MEESANGTPQEITDADITPEAILKTVQSKRLGMLLGHEQIDKGERYLMNELAETAVQCRKIESDEEIAGDDRDTALAFANIISNMDHNPLLGDSTIEGEFEVIAPDLPAIEVMPGEAGLEMEDLNYEDFTHTAEEKK